MAHKQLRRCGVWACAARFKCKSKNLGEGLIYCGAVNRFDHYLCNNRWHCGDAIYSTPDNSFFICLNYTWHQFSDVQFFVDLVWIPFSSQDP